MRYNLTKTVRKRPIDNDGAVLMEWFIDRGVDIKHEARAQLRTAAPSCHNPNTHATPPRLRCHHPG